METQQCKIWAMAGIFRGEENIVLRQSLPSSLVTNFSGTPNTGKRHVLQICLRSFQLSTTFAGRVHLNLPLFTGKTEEKKEENKSIPTLNAAQSTGRSLCCFAFFSPVGSKLKQFSAWLLVTGSSPDGFRAYHPPAATSRVLLESSGTLQVMPVEKRGGGQVQG